MTSTEGFLRKIEATATIVSILVIFGALQEYTQDQASYSTAGDYYGSFVSTPHDQNSTIDLFIQILPSGKVEGRIVKKGKASYRGKIKGSTNRKGISFASFNPAEKSTMFWNGSISNGKIEGIYQELLSSAPKGPQHWSVEKR